MTINVHEAKTRLSQLLIAALQRLPWRHRDPFDRMLIAQATVMSLSIVTRDPSFTLYDVDIVWDRAK